MKKYKEGDIVKIVELRQDYHIFWYGLVHYVKKSEIRRKGENAPKPGFYALYGCWHGDNNPRNPDNYCKIQNLRHNCYVIGNVANMDDATLGLLL
jgi:hypothetical protein